MRSLLGLAFLSFSWMTIGAQTSSPIAALINGTELPQQVTNIPREDLILAFVGRHFREPASASDEQELDQLRIERICRNLNFAVKQGVRDAAKKRLGVFVTAADLDAERQKAKFDDPAIEAKAAREKASAMIAGLAAVYDQAQPANEAYAQFVKAHGISESEWARAVYVARTPSGRSKIGRPINATAETFASAQKAIDFRPAAESRKLDAAVDAELAASDPVFKRHIEEWRSGLVEPDPSKRWISADKKEYLDAKRQEWWQRQTLQLRIAVSDPSLSDRCALEKTGARVIR